MVEKTNKFENFFECEMMVIRPNDVDKRKK